MICRKSNFCENREKRLNIMKIQTSVILSENLLSTIGQLSEKDKTLSDIIEAALQSYIAKLKKRITTLNSLIKMQIISTRNLRMLCNIRLNCETGISVQGVSSFR